MRRELVLVSIGLTVAGACVQVGSTPEEFRAFVAAETKRYADVVRETKIPMQ